ncbi:NADPH:quinone reductase [Linnemannia schmuckeri]|uniref:Probable quinone oxidoreductase n=1 Tax=Linnemannia schmuckeri TaxID=64567 RepID=A0A9P5RKK3_9FUNG|nr:NADPH:quinone reductase [Linnemannia schmuckeri]
MVNSTARVIRVAEHGDVSVLQPTTIPRPIPRPTEVLVKIAYAGVNYIDIYERSGNYPTPAPLIPGREGSGEVVEVGSEVQGFKIGDRVAFMSQNTYSDYAVVDTLHLVKLPDNVSLETGAALVLQGLTAVGLVRKGYTIQKGDWIVVHAAAGGVGLLLSQLGRLLGAHVIGTVSTEEKAALAHANGAEHVVLINNGYEALEKKVRELTNGEGVHAVFDSVGQATFESSLNVVRRLGTLVLFGSASGAIPPLNLVRLAGKNVKVTWATVYNYITTHEEFNELIGDTLEYLEKGQLKFAIHKVYPVEDVQQAHLDLEGRKTTGKLLLKIQ